MVNGQELPGPWVCEVTAQFESYERALMANDVDALDTSYGVIR